VARSLKKDAEADEVEINGGQIIICLGSIVFFNKIHDKYRH